MSKSGKWLNGVAGTFLFLIIVLNTCVLGKFVDRRLAVETMTDMGFTHVEVLKHDYIMVVGNTWGENCQFTVRAVNPNGRVIQAYVYASYHRDGTSVRFSPVIKDTVYQYQP